MTMRATVLRILLLASVRLKLITSGGSVFVTFFLALSKMVTRAKNSMGTVCLIHVSLQGFLAAVCSVA